MTNLKPVDVAIVGGRWSGLAWPRKLRHAADSTWSCWRKGCRLICNC